LRSRTARAERQRGGARQDKPLQTAPPEEFSLHEEKLQI
jgi:hypothetical protein